VRHTQIRQKKTTIKKRKRLWKGEGEGVTLKKASVCDQRDTNKMPSAREKTEWDRNPANLKESETKKKIR